MKRKNSMTHGRTVQRLAVATVASLISLAAYGQATVDPDTQPFMTLAPYVLKSSNLEPRVGNTAGGTRAYRPWFENGAWTGDLVEYDILATGQRVPRNDIGRYPRDGAAWRGTSPLWTARYSFPDFVPYDPNDSTWTCVEEDATYWQTRNIFTIRNTNSKVPFLWNQLTAAQRLALDQVTAADNTLDTDPYVSPFLNYVRGDRSLERCKVDGQFRWRFSLLGSIVNSRPVYVPAGTGDGVVVVGANSGMLHGFSATNGDELWAYIPSLILDRVGLQREPATRPRYLMDGELRHRDIGVPNAAQHIVTGGLGAGGKGLFVLDVTDPSDPGVITEIAGATAGFVGGAADNRIGYIHGRPTIARLPDGSGGSRWYVVSGNGYASTNGRAHLVLIPLDGTPTPEFRATDATDNNGLSAPSLIDATGNGVVDYAYAGDLQGNLWRFDFNNNNVQRVFTAGPSKPIVVEPDIARHPVTDDGFMIYFGTGSLLSGADVAVTSQQSVYGIWDRPLNTAHNSWLPIDVNRLATQTLQSADVTWDIPTGSCGATLGTNATTTVRFIQAPPDNPTWTGASPNLGWQVHLPRAGERVIGHPQVRAERIQFITTNPYDMANPPERNAFPTDAAHQAALNQSGSWMLQLDLATGGNALRARALFDLNKDCTLSVTDGAPIGATAFDATTIPTGQYPVGVNLGPYNIAQPAFARVRFDASVGSVVDGVYINALYLPPQDPPNNVIHGPLDVTTDSPGGPSHAPLPEPLKSPFTFRLFPEASGPTKRYLRSDGLGHGVDGHSMGYNKHHGVDYVDFFRLEPRRGQTRLDAGVMYDAGGTYEPIVLDPTTPSGLRTSQRELNRVEEVTMPDNQRFIIVLTNADLSRGNEIRIGARTWPVYEYQTIMMQHLRAATPAQMMTGLLADNLVFTLRGDFNPICPPSLGLTPDACDNRLRITPTERIGSLDATMGTLPGCVNNTDRYEGDLINDPYITRKRRHISGSRNDIANWETILDDSGNLRAGYTLEDLYADGRGDSNVRDNPHATPYPPAQGSQIVRELGYRWRNGSLTVQLLAVNSDNTPAFEIQDSIHLPRPNAGVAAVEGIDIGWGGAYAKAFNVVSGAVVPLNNPPGRFVGNSGLLYELSMFWHWGDMARFQSQGQGSPVVPVCYGTRTYTPSLAREVEWFTPGAYQQLTAEFTGTAAREALQDEYAALIAQIAAGTGDLDAAVRRLQEILSSSQNLTTYHRLRHYVPNSKQLNENHLIRIDRGDWNINLAVDGTPVDVIDVERDLLPSLGPNYQPGRRSWIDLVPE